MLHELQVPNELTRNHASIRKAGVIRTGKLLIEKTLDACGLTSLAETNVLDVGCGTRFTQTLINRKKFALKSYTGIDVDKSVIDWLKANVEAKDERFHYAHWDVVNALYNKGGGDLTAVPGYPSIRTKSLT
jgi:SAM-dependent methyltransferase